MDQNVVLRTHNVTKTFKEVTVVSKVSLELKKGEIHALVGENGAGKSTLIKMLSGVHQPSSGSLEYEGDNTVIQNPAFAHKLGIFTVHQEPAIMPQLSVAENVFMGFHPLKRVVLNWVDRKEMFKRAREVFGRLGINLDVAQSAASLTIAQQQMVEIAKAVIHEVKVLVLDEPTATLTSHETQILFQIVRNFVSEGTAVLFVSHRLDEVFELASTVTVMRDGQKVGTYAVSDLDAKELVKLMVGRDISTHQYRGEKSVGSDPILSVRSLTKRPWFSNVTFDLFPGEILGMAGLVGSGRTNVAEAIFGVVPSESGDIYISGERRMLRNVKQAKQYGVVYVPEDRHKHGLALQMNILHNITLPSLSGLTNYGVLNRKGEMELAKRMVSSLNIRSTSIFQTVAQLSGGNQQKVVFSKWIAQHPKIIILDEPTRGVDVGAKDEIYNIIHQLAGEGAAILVVSSDLPELLGIADRVLVMKEGSLVASIPREEMSEENIMYYATGVNKQN